MTYTKAEQNLLHRKVYLIADVDYGGNVGVIPLGTEGVIVDFGNSSGDPIVRWDYSHELTVVPISYLHVAE